MKRARSFMGIGLGLSLLLCLCVTPLAAAQDVPQGYQSDQPLQKGQLVRLKPGDETKVEAVTQTGEASMLGVVVSAADAPVSLSNNADAQQVYIATAGKYEALVSTQNGTIEIGDYIAVSSLAGVGMKAGTGQKAVLGKALGAFDGKSRAESTATLTDSAGQKRQVALGHIAVDLGVGHNPIAEVKTAGGVPKSLSRAAQVVTDRPVSALRIYASLGILIVAVIIAGSILYAGVRSGITAIGRNPLAKSSILRNLVTVTLMSLIVFVVGLTAIYLVLRL